MLIVDKYLELTESNPDLIDGVVNGWRSLSEAVLSGSSDSEGESKVCAFKSYCPVSDDLDCLGCFLKI